jgi:cbb3-type cytochrome oxidase cytochrome c subunit
MAADVLSALAMSAEAERVFSRARRQISFDRACPKSDIIGQKECLKSWHIQQLVDETVIVQESQEPS